ncbi:hypothetical protein GBAR_LOCUS11762 [Geodia barretti]|uniref:Uncharacterized protein n=1 Tax=Geodia barretti TaxID=519541 RepID=A0AA35RXJ4_GEOBA|nr:hypothetical protein GBAR_LOCUS11762 [Geodia barretti]
MATVLLGPVHGQPAILGHLAAHVPGQFPVPLFGPAATAFPVRGQFLLNEIAQFLAKGVVFGSKSKIHSTLPDNQRIMAEKSSDDIESSWPESVRPRRLQVNHGIRGSTDDAGDGMHIFGYQQAHPGKVLYIDNRNNIEGSGHHVRRIYAIHAAKGSDHLAGGANCGFNQ